MKIGDRYKMALSKFTYRLLNYEKDNRHNLYTTLISNRNVRNRSQNKLGPQPRVESNDLFTLKSYTYKIRLIYNSLKRELTLMNNYSLFKKWIMIFYFVPETTRFPRPVADASIIDSVPIIEVCNYLHDNDHNHDNHYNDNHHNLP